MNFLEWNNRIAEHFFNSSQAGKDILLFITKQEIINLARENFDGESDQEIWIDFLVKIRNGLPGSSGFPNLFDKAVHSFQQWKRPGLKSIEGIELKYPPYISHLVFTVLPLIEIQGDYYASNYYDRLDDFLAENCINQNLRGKLRTIDDLWSDLSNWANEVNNGKLGFFKLLTFTNRARKFVYKPFSQCVLPPKAIRKLPDFFYTSGLTPKTFYQDDIFRKHLIRNGLSILGLKPGVIDIIKKTDDEIGRSIIETVKSEFEIWTGEEHEIILKDGIEKHIRKQTVVPIKLQFKLNEDGEIDFSFRIKYITEPPPGLKFEEFDDIYENENWSRTFRRQFDEHFELRDPINKWTAKFEFRNMRLFIRGGYFLLGNDFWIETETLSRVEEMYLLCGNDIKNSIKVWGEKNCSHFIDCSTFPNIPAGYSLFRFKNPQTSHEQFQQLKVYKKKKISLREGTGLKIGYRTYLNELLPEIEISNADGTESVYFQYEGRDDRFFLQRHPSFGGIWLLPSNLILNSNFLIQIENEHLEGTRQNYKIDEAFYQELSNDILPKRNKHNSIINDTDNFIQGNNVQFYGFRSNLVDEQSFNPSLKARIQQIPIKFTDSLLLKWLVGVKDCDILKFNEVFEIVLRNTFKEPQHDFQQRRKSSIHLLDYLGYVDYDYSSGKICTLPPKLISIPSTYGLKVLLIGGRTEKLINEMMTYCLKSDGEISLSIKKQSKSNQQLLLPDAIIFESNSKTCFLNLVNEFQIEFDEWYILKLKNFLTTLLDYEQYQKDQGSSESWERFGLETKVFNKDSLKFEICGEPDKTYSLSECKPGYIHEYGLWIDQAYFPVDKNWGKYLFLNHI